MTFKLVSSDIFLKQIKKLDKKSKNTVKNKIYLIKENPYRYKRIHSRVLSKVFRIRLNIQNKETRLIYAVTEPNIILVCLLERKKNYKDLEKYLKRINN